MVGCSMFVVFKSNLNISFSILFDFFNEASSYRKKKENDYCGPVYTYYSNKSKEQNQLAFLY